MQVQERGFRMTFEDNRHERGSHTGVGSGYSSHVGHVSRANIKTNHFQGSLLEARGSSKDREIA
jgi:hypothetical protein